MKDARESFVGYSRPFGPNFSTNENILHLDLFLKGHQWTDLGHEEQRCTFRARQKYHSSNPNKCGSQSQFSSAIKIQEKCLQKWYLGIKISIYLSGVMTDRYRSQPIPMMAKDEKKMGNFLTAIMKLHKVSVSCPNGHFWNNISQRLTGKVIRHSRKSEVANVPMNELWAVRIFFLDTMAPRTEKKLNIWNHVKNLDFDRKKYQIATYSSKWTKYGLLEQWWPFGNFLLQLLIWLLFITGGYFGYFL